MTKQIKIGIISALAFVAFIVVMNTFTITQAGMTKVQVCFGEVQEDKLFSEGFHFPVNPLCSFDTFDTRESREELENLSIPTQDRFNSSANVTVLYRIQPGAVVQIRKDFGTQERYIDVTMRKHAQAAIRNEGRNLKDSRDLAVSGNITAMQVNVTEYLRQNVTGLDINEVLIQDINFDPRITQQILNTQDRIQKEETEKSQERISQTKANQKIEEARGTSESQKLATDADTYKVRQTADAERYAAEQRAIANHKLSASLTPQLLRQMELENEKVLFSNSKGHVPHTVIGETNLRAYGIPTYNVQSK